MQVTIFKMRGYLTICGFVPGAVLGDFENWHNGDNCVQLCVSHDIVPDFCVQIILKTLKEDPIKFKNIIGLIN
jgi:hypothetical protein